MECCTFEGTATEKLTLNPAPTTLQPQICVSLNTGILHLLCQLHFRRRLLQAPGQRRHQCRLFRQSCPARLKSRRLRSQSWDLQLLPHLERLCERICAWGPIQVSSTPLWADAWVAWLPKPSKAADRPENLRPISLTEAGGRIVVKALATHLRPLFTEATRQWPQYAYTPGRRIDHAIARAMSRCHAPNPKP